ncbi:MAG: small multi-drug export protein [Oscillospiraceae bacterium]|nr:small multi-drug export protein [Oscillospiraceae bacterium]
MNWLMDTTGGNFLLTLLVAMVPVVELRGAIPFGVALGLPIPLSVIASIIGNLIPTPFIIVYVRRIFQFLRRINRKLNGLVTRLEDRAHLKSASVEKYGMVGLCILVAIPLPGTGAWTGSLVAALLDMRLKRAMPAVIVGVCIAAVIVTTITYGVTALI